ncbi:unnamed protein product, partial [Nesidiocoris tenuis]
RNLWNETILVRRMRNPMKKRSNQRLKKHRLNGQAQAIRTSPPVLLTLDRPVTPRSHYRSEFLVLGNPRESDYFQRQYASVRPVRIHLKTGLGRAVFLQSCCHQDRGRVPHWPQLDGHFFLGSTVLTGLELRTGVTSGFWVYSTGASQRGIIYSGTGIVGLNFNFLWNEWNHKHLLNQRYSLPVCLYRKMIYMVWKCLKPLKKIRSFRYGTSEWRSGKWLNEFRIRVTPQSMRTKGDERELRAMWTLALVTIVYAAGPVHGVHGRTSRSAEPKESTAVPSSLSSPLANDTSSSETPTLANTYLPSRRERPPTPYVKSTTTVSTTTDTE